MNVAHPVNYGKVERINFSKIDEVLAPPNLIEIQKKSYEWFKTLGIEEVIEEIGPISPDIGAYDPIKDKGASGSTHYIEFFDFKFDDEPKYSLAETKIRETTYAVPTRAKVRLVNRETGEAKESEIFMGEFPLMTESGTFIINGAERVIVSQLVRSPGVYFAMVRDKSGKQLFSSTMIPNRGAWIEFETDTNDIFTVRIDRERKVLCVARSGHCNFAVVGTYRRSRKEKLVGPINDSVALFHAGHHLLEGFNQFCFFKLNHCLLSLLLIGDRLFVLCWFRTIPEPFFRQEREKPRNDVDCPAISKNSVTLRIAHTFPVIPFRDGLKPCTLCWCKPSYTKNTHLFTIEHDNAGVLFCVFRRDY